MTIQEAYEQGITMLGRTTWGRAAWLELRVVRGLLSMTAVTHMNYMASRETPLHQLPHDGWERWTHHTTPDLADPPQDDMPLPAFPSRADCPHHSEPTHDDKPSQPLPVPPSP